MFSGSNVLITGGNFINIDTAHEEAFKILQDAAAPSAFYDSGEQSSPLKCHRNTRLDVWKEIEDWAQTPLDSRWPCTAVMWMHASAGVGKTAIARMLAERRTKGGTLLAAFFFSRFDPLRNNGEHLIATIAYQAALNIPEIREAILSALIRNPLVFKQLGSLEDQFTSLIIQPLLGLLQSGFFDHTESPRLIILDGLDECEDQAVQFRILRLISTTLDGHSLPLKFLVSSRPELHLAIGFKADGFYRRLEHLDLAKFVENGDIRTFLTDKFDEIRRTHRDCRNILYDWPGAAAIDGLVKKASGQFVYASTIVKYVESARHRPTQRMEIILGIRSTRTDSDTPFEALDELYRHIFSSLGDVELVLDILCLALITPSLMLRDIDEFLSIDAGDSEFQLGELASVLTLPKVGHLNCWNSKQLWVEITHASLDDFLRDASRSKELYLNSPSRHTTFLHRCFEIISGLGNCEMIERWSIGHIYSRIPHHMSHAQFTPGLRHDILNLSFTSILRDSRLSIKFFFDFIIGYLNSTSKLDVELHRKLIQMFREEVINQLEKYYSDLGLTFLVTVASLVAEEHWKRDYARVGDLARRNHTGTEVDDQGLKIANALARNCANSLEYLKLLSGIWNDPNTPPKYALDGPKFAIGVLICIKYLCRHPVCQCPPAPESRCTTFYSNKVLQCEHDEGIRRFILPHLVRRSAKLDELLAFINQHEDAKTVLQNVVAVGKIDNEAINPYL